jgi:hypothetical protein
MTYFDAVRIYATIEAAIFTSLLVVWIGGISEQAEMVLGWTHGVGWILLCLLVFEGCRKRVFSWPVLAATVSPLGPIGATIGIELDRRGRRVA